MRCDVCQREGSGHVVCSSLGAFSLNYCSECLKSGAEPKAFVDALLEDCGGLENIRDDIKDSTSIYKDGEYVKLRDYK